MIYGYDETGLTLIIGRMAIANSRLSEEILMRDAKIANLEKRLEEVTSLIEEEKEHTNG